MTSPTAPALPDNALSRAGGSASSAPVSARGAGRAGAQPHAEPASGSSHSLETLDALLTELRTFTRRIKKNWAAARHEVTLVEAILLGEIACRPQATAIEIATDLGIDKSTASRQLAGLEKRGLIRRDELPGERRAQALSLTDEGREVLHAEKRARLTSLTQRLADWTDEDVADFLRLLKRFNTLEALGTGAKESDHDDAAAPGASGCRPCSGADTTADQA